MKNQKAYHTQVGKIGRTPTLHDFQNLIYDLENMSLPDDAKVEIKTDHPDRPGEMSVTTARVTWFVEEKK